MRTFAQLLFRRLRPHVGWPLLILGLAVVLTPAMAAGASPLGLPAATFGWAGLLGLLVGLCASSAEHQVVASDEHQVMGAAADARNTRHSTPHAPRNRLWLLLAVILGALLLLGVLGALPPLGLIAQDARALLGWLEQIVRRALVSIGWHSAAPALETGVRNGPPLSRTWLFMGQALPRAWGDLLAAPSSGEKGARLVVAFGGVASVWVGAIMLGWALRRRRSLAGWSLPLLGALTFVATLGGGSALPLVAGLALLLLLGMAADVRRREIAWDRAGVDFPGEQLGDIFLWGGTLAGIIVLLATLLPAWLDNPIASALWPEVEVPSGLAVLERNIQRAQRSPTVDPGISTLPALDLGVSLESAPPETVALRVRLAAPNGSASQLPAAPWPRYWRARVFTIYNGQGWTQNAHISPYDVIDPRTSTIPGAIVQEIEDVRPERGLLFGLPNIVGVDVPSNAERLADGELAALTTRTPAGRYRVLSRPQELAQAPPDQPPPDMRGYLGLPNNIPPQIGEAARAQVVGLASTYDQALALEQFLRELPYSYQVQPLPGGGDAVYQFLFQMRSGYCTYYASAMAVMARSLGIPARVATGYATGAYDSATGMYVVHEADAHAWPELYINGRWLPFEPTPVRPLPARSVEAEQPPVEVPAEEPLPSGLSGPLIWLAVLIMVGLLTAGGIWMGRRPAPAPLVAQVQARLERNGARAGVPWPAGATLHEYGALLEPRLDGAAEALHEMVELVARARYGHHTLRADEELRLRAAEERVWAQLRRGDQHRV